MENRKGYKLNEENRCPYCDSKVDGATEISGDKAPKPGDVSICFYCIQFLVFDENLGVKKPSAELEKELNNDKNLSDFRHFLKNKDRS